MKKLDSFPYLSCQPPSDDGRCSSAIRIAEALRESESKFRLLTENLDEIFWFMELDPPRITYVSPAFEKVWGLPIANLYSDHECWERSIHPDDLPAVETAYGAWKSGQTEKYQLEYRVLKPDGSTRWVLDRGIVIGHKDGHPHHLCGIARDITERKCAEQALQASEERFRSFFEIAGVGTAQLDANSKFISVNDRMCAITGYSREELLSGMSPLDIDHPDDLEANRARILSFVRGQTTQFETEKRYVRKNGTLVWVLVSASAVRHADGSFRYGAGVVQDITDRKLAEQALHASEELLRLFVEHSPAPVAMFDREMHYLVASKCWTDAFRLPDTPIIGRSHFDVFPDIPELWKHIYQRCLAGATESCERDQFPRADGSLDWVKWECRPWHESHGEIGGIIIFVEVINERVRIENEIAYARRFAESTLEAVPASLAVLNAQGIIVGTNQAWHEFARANGAIDSQVGKGVNYLAVCDAAAATGDEQAAHFAEGIRDVMSGESKRFYMEYPCHAPHQQRWFVGYVTPFMGNGPHSVVIAHVDISERKRAEQVIRRLNDELESRVEHRTQQLLSANNELRKQIALRKQLEEEILHVSEREQQRIGQDLHDDLGQQLAGIWLLSDVLKSSLAKQDSPEAENAEKITALLKNALALTRSLSRGLHPVAVQQGGLVAALDELTDRTCEMFQVNCRCKCPPGIELDHTTATHLYRIAQEAVTNAVKHGKAKEIDIELSTNPNHTVLTVRDQGTGITELDPNQKGMGLRIMSYRADMIGGTLDIQRSQNGIGTTVVCSIPTPLLNLKLTTPIHAKV